MTYKIGIVGVGKIARDQHIPVINDHPDFELIATVSSSTGIEGIDNYSNLQAMLDAHPELDAVALCMPPSARYQPARIALENNKHILLEKPPGATLAEVESLRKIAQQRNLTAYASWHSRHASSVEAAKELLATVTIKVVDIQWRESVRQWHPDQEWIWQPGGMGVFDPGINALSIVTHILPWDFSLAQALLSFPENRQTPIAASLKFYSPKGVPVLANFDWRESSNQVWKISFETSIGKIILSEGGDRLFVNGIEQKVPQTLEYFGVYNHFRYLLNKQQSDLDIRPAQHVADAFVLAERAIVEPFK